MRHIVLDTSVVVKWFRNPRDEPLVAEAKSLEKQFLEGEIRVIVPELLLYEFGNVIRMKSGLEAPALNVIIAALWEMNLVMIPTNPHLMQRTMEFAFQHNITFYDATFVGLAQILDCDFITADEKLHSRISSLPKVSLLDSI